MVVYIKILGMDVGVPFSTRFLTSLAIWVLDFRYTSIYLSHGDQICGQNT